MSRHHWITGPDQRSRRAALGRLRRSGELPGEVSLVDAHRRLRGPYTAAGSMIRMLVPELLEAQPDLVARHATEILSVAPELGGRVPAALETLTSLAVPDERTRFYSRLRTLRLAHGLAEFLRDALPSTPARSVLLENLDHADPTDLELVAVLLRRLDPGVLTLVLGSRTEVTAPFGPAFETLTERHRAESLPARDHADLGPENSPAQARAFVWSDGTSDDPLLHAAYGRLDPDRAVRLHEARARELDAQGEWSHHLGAIPWHREHGGDPAGEGAAALEEALDYCINMGFYDATVEFGTRGRAVVDWDRQLDLYWIFTTKMTTSLAALGRPAEAEALYDEARARTDDPSIHLQAAYATAMLYTRHHSDELKDHVRAKGFVNAAIAYARQLADPKQRAFQMAFNRNGLALIEVHLKHLPTALDLVDAGLADLDRLLEPGEHRLHRSVLVYNRAQVHAGLGDLEAALADYDKVIAEDPNYSEYYFERGNLYRRAGRPQKSLADYDAAIRLSPPYPEAYYNRADLRAELGEVGPALEDFTEVLELDPEHVDARINRAGLLLDLTAPDLARSAENADRAAAAAAEDVRAGLALDPGNAHLLCLAARLAERRQDGAAAETLYTAALDAAPDLAAAWSGRAIARFGRGDVERAVADLTAALRIAPDPVTLYNRGVAHQSLAAWSAAVADFTAALEFGGDDPDLHFERARSHAELGDTDSARRDLQLVAGSPATGRRDEALRLLAALPPETAAARRTRSQSA